MKNPSPIFRLALVLGGARSGKSGYALSLAAGFPQPRLFVATCEPRDEEMRARIDNHQQERGPDWETREACLDLPDFLAGPPGGYGVILVDCLTMWLSNLMLKEGANQAGIRAECERLQKALAATSTPTILVSNEVGWGIVPENALARAFRDQAGWLHQRVAEVADLVVLVVAGLPMVIKK
ncbi:MAG: bifunctional adenosylcobinamide kinase/adenosylcobinamide-phosphate guanylyltransferase [Thermodesulfobacteriota bacterium]